MDIKDLYRKRRRTWESLLALRKGGEKRKTAAADGEDLLQKKISLITDPGSFRELFAELQAGDPLNFPGYREKLFDLRQKLGVRDAFLAGEAKIAGRRAAIGFMDSRFLMGSMGAALGEKVARLAEYAGEHKLPLIIFTASGGARMQEGLFSLMQMAKTAAAITRFKEDGGLYIACLTHPTTGGVSASFASLGDIILAEPEALICFAGPRVIQQTIGETLPEGFQRAEFLLEHGMIDRIVEPENWRKVLRHLLKLHGVRRS